ncbi:DNA cytosine methyltransferase [Flaviflexus equikiangi]|uniref:DNA cytosine methyltransferase n=1 Tax=Flaviflexus equikiangi TaxID=2758573 RepID=A0ABS2TCX4_9ACTO|nr:DNA cytosine methyltransferase [Flaviflexus equikiangi]MBM9432495.1 DNA cytosine methyltransferase [Flaviflexus equikiangi]
MHDQEDKPPLLKIGSLFSGYGGLDLAVEHAFNAETVWFSELSQPASRVFAHHWHGVPNLGDITAINWHEVEPVDILIGGFPCQEVSTVGKRAGLAPGTRSGLWAHMAKAIDTHSSPNVSSSRTSGAYCPPQRHDHPQKETAVPHATPATQPPTMQPFASWSPTRGIWETTQLDLYGLTAPVSPIWPTRDWTHAGSAHRRPLSTLPTTASTFSSSPTARFRTLLAADSTRGGETRNDHTVAPDHRLRTPRTCWLTEQESRVGDTVVPDRRTLQRWGRYADAITRWEHIT